MPAMYLELCELMTRTTVRYSSPAVDHYIAMRILASEAQPSED